MKTKAKDSKKQLTRGFATIGAALKEERKTLGMTQVETAKQFGISLKALRNLEQDQGGVSLSTAIRILKYLGKEFRVGNIAISPSHSPTSRPRRNQIIETLNLVRPVLKKKFNVKSIALYGSCARDKATKFSDIDIAVQFFAPSNISTLGKLTAFLETLFDGHKVDLVELRQMNDHVLEHAKKDWILV